MLRHLLRRLEAVQVDSEPFAHFYLEQVFPDDVYRVMVERLPGEGFYRPDNPRKYKRQDGLTSRNVMGLNDDVLERLPDATRQLWSGIAMALSSRRSRTRCSIGCRQISAGDSGRMPRDCAWCLRMQGPGWSETWEGIGSSRTRTRNPRS